MITTAKAQEIMAATKNPHIQILCETIVELWRMFAEANCDAVMTRDELDELMARIGKTNSASLATSEQGQAQQ